jgi:hypothetical protein
LPGEREIKVGARAIDTPYTDRQIHPEIQAGGLEVDEMAIDAFELTGVESCFRIAWTLLALVSWQSRII